MSKLSCLQTEKHARAGEHLSYQFLHLTFQEFFAAQCIAQHFNQGTSLHISYKTKQMPGACIQANKYNPRYEIVWWFVAGLLRESKLAEFFVLLEEGSQDLIGLQHQHMMMHCLKESHDKLPRKQQALLESTLYNWFILELRLTSEYDVEHCLAAQAAFPEALLLQLLKEVVLTSLEKEKI